MAMPFSQGAAQPAGGGARCGTRPVVRPGVAALLILGAARPAGGCSRRRCCSAQCGYVPESSLWWHPEVVRQLRCAHGCGVRGRFARVDAAQHGLATHSGRRAAAARVRLCGPVWPRCSVGAPLGPLTAACSHCRKILPAAKAKLHCCCYLRILLLCWHWRRGVQ